MIYRHPHVFGNADVNTTEEVLANWDELKKKEKHFNTMTDELNGVAKALPALIRAAKVQKKAKKLGFDFENVDKTLEKIKEEINELEEVYKTDNVDRITEELGDLLFSCVNTARFLNVDSEEALNKCINKFIERFSYIENTAISLGLNLKEMSLKEMDELWEKTKKVEK